MTNSFATPPRRVDRFLPVVLVLAISLAYVTSFRGAFVFDDLPAIVENPSLRDLSRLADVFSIRGGHGAPTDGRPLLNFTLALNYAISGADPWSYHALNLAIHLSAALALWGILRRTLPECGPSGGTTPAVVFTIALWWAVHPLQTQAVTYVVQRAESLMGLCYLLTLFFFVRGTRSPRPRRWYLASFLACFSGMAAKEVMVSAPLIVLLYDRTFVAESWSETWRRRGRFHAALLSTWILLAVLVAGTEGRGGTAGFASSVEWGSYALTQCRAIVLYLRLALWPHPLVGDHGTALLHDWRTVVPEAILLLVLLVGTGWALVRKPKLGFLGAWFFLILAPSSSVVPVATQTIAEHRMYLPLAAVVVGLVFGMYRLAGTGGIAVLLVLAVGAGWLTARRNLVYRSEFAFWSDTVARCPDNPRARTNLGVALLEAGRIEESIAQCQAALRMDATNAAAHVNLCAALRRVGRSAEAIAYAREALRLEPDHLNAHINLAHALVDIGDDRAAVGHYERALQLQPDARDVQASLAAAHGRIGVLLVREHRLAAATEHFRAMLALRPDDPDAHANLGNVLLLQRDPAGALRHYEAALRKRPDDRRLRDNIQLAREALAR